MKLSLLTDEYYKKYNKLFGLNKINNYKILCRDLLFSYIYKGNTLCNEYKYNDYINQLFKSIINLEKKQQGNPSYNFQSIILQNYLKKNDNVLIITQIAGVIYRLKLLNQLIGINIDTFLQYNKSIENFSDKLAKYKTNIHIKIRYKINFYKY
jgi:hypothetical protein